MAEQPAGLARGAFAEAAGRAGVPVTAIGRFEAGEGVSVLGPEGKELSLASASFSHF